MSFPFMLLIMISDFVVLCANIPDLCSTSSVLLTSAVAILTFKADRESQYPPPYSVQKYISQYVSCLDSTSPR